jgi:hypothetical protein
MKAVNMVGTCQTDRTGAGALGKAGVKAKEIEIGSHESLIYQHNTKPLLYCVWGDNNFVKTLSNDKILESLASGTNNKDAVTAVTTKRTPLLASTLKTTALYGSCNQVSHTTSQLIHSVRKIAYPLQQPSVMG